MTLAASEDFEIVRFYRISKYPLMLGRLPDGSKIWGGPYTSAQGFAGVGAILLTLSTWGLWAHYGLIGNLVIFATAVCVPVYLAGTIRTKSRNPLMIFMGVMKAFASPAAGSVGATTFKFRAPHQVTGTVVVDGINNVLAPTREDVDDTAVVGADPLPAPVQAPASPLKAPETKRAVTAIERLMAETTRNS